MALAQAKATNKPPAQPQRVSFNPDTQTTGFLDDVDVEITDAQATEFDYGGNSDSGPVPVLCLELTDTNGNPHVQYWSVGKATDWQATEDNTGFTSLSGKTGFSSQSNVAMLFKSMVEVGGEAIVPILNSGDVTKLIGMKVHVMIKTLPKRSGLIRTGRNAEKDPTVLLVSKIHSLPGTAKTGAAKPATTAKPATGKPNGATAAAATEDSSAIDSILAAALLNDLAQAPDNKLPKKVMIQIAGREFNSPELKAQRSAAITRASKQEFLASLAEHGIQFSGTEFSLA